MRIEPYSDEIYPLASLGLFSIQLAKLSGYKVVTTVSPKNFDIVKSLGADAVVDVSAFLYTNPSIYI